MGDDLLATCHVHWARPVDPQAAPELVGLLDDHERERLGRFRRQADRARFLAAHALTRTVLAEFVGTAPAALRFDRTCACGEQHGKPTLLLPGAPAFSITHSGDLVGIAVHARPVGLDAEEIRPLSDLAAMAEHVCSPVERVSSSAEFFTLWTGKEAVLKVTGDGLSVAMNTLTLLPDGVDWPGVGTALWVVPLAPSAGYAAAVAGVGLCAPEIVEHPPR